MPSPYDPSATAAAPQLGYGQRGAAPIDAFNQWFRARPEYYAKLKEFGQDPTNVHLNDAQKQQMVRLAQSLGAVVDEGHDGQEVDDSGNFRAKSHKLRNTLIVAGIAGAALATAGLAGAFGGAAGIGGSAGAAGGVEAGATAGLGGVALPGAGTALGGAGFTAVGAPLASAATAGGAAADVGAGAAAPAVAGSTLPAATYGANGVVTNFAASPAIAGAAGTPMLENILRYGVPTVGNLVGGIIQANASGKASDAQQKYLEEALAYQKEQDAYNRKTAAEHYDYSKNTEASRYGDYTNNIAGYLATGSSANDRMAALLGLSPSAVSGGRGSASPRSQAVPVTPEITDALTKYYKSLGLTPTGEGTGPTDIAYMAKQIANTGGLTPDNVSYWLDPSDKGRITQELNKAGVKYSQPSAANPVTAGYTRTNSDGSGLQPITTQPQARSADPTQSATVNIKAPDGSVRQVPASQKDHWLSVGGLEVAA